MVGKLERFFGSRLPCQPAPVERVPCAGLIRVVRALELCSLATIGTQEIRGRYSRLLPVAEVQAEGAGLSLGVPLDVGHREVGATMQVTRWLTGAVPGSRYYQLKFP